MCAVVSLSLQPHSAIGMLIPSMSLPCALASNPQRPSPWWRNSCHSSTAETPSTPPGTKGEEAFLPPPFVAAFRWRQLEKSVSAVFSLRFHSTTRHDQVWRSPFLTRREAKQSRVRIALFFSALLLSAPCSALGTSRSHFLHAPPTFPFASALASPTFVNLCPLSSSVCARPSQEAVSQTATNAVSMLEPVTTTAIHRSHHRTAHGVHWRSVVLADLQLQSSRRSSCWRNAP